MTTLKALISLLFVTTMFGCAAAHQARVNPTAAPKARVISTSVYGHRLYTFGDWEFVDATGRDGVVELTLYRTVSHSDEQVVEGAAFLSIHEGDGYLAPNAPCARLAGLEGLDLLRTAGSKTFEMHAGYPSGCARCKAELEALMDTIR